RDRPGPGAPPPLPQSPPETVSAGGSDWRITAFSNPSISLIIALNLSDFYDQMHRMRNLILAVLPPALLLIAAGGWFTAHRAVRSITLLTETTRSVSASDLTRRVPEHTTDRELKELIAVTNSMLDRLETSFRQAVRFSGDAAHELKTPVTILQGELDAAVQAAPEGSPLQTQLAGLLEQVSRLSRIIRNLLLLARADAGRLNIRRESIDFSALVREQLEDIEVLDTSLTVVDSVPAGMIVQGDPGLLRHLISNLVTNAVKYNNQGGIIRLGLQQDTEKQVTILEIANSGPGIPPEDRAHVFERFYRGDPERNSGLEGSGLGLSIAREIARFHGGDVSLISTDDAWTVFRVNLPTAQPPEMRSPDATSSTTD
ncbi:MAG TPA: ATP-binding protein, partial [bacterium]|nr:ATP-binding protein [bacterium]